MEAVEAFSIRVCEYTDTRMGGNNPVYSLSPRLTLDGVKKEIVKCLNKKTWRGGENHPKVKAKDFEIKLKRGKSWTHDFGPEIVTVTKVKIQP
jgi:hypothetical protein